MAKHDRILVLHTYFQQSIWSSQNLLITSHHRSSAVLQQQTSQDPPQATDQQTRNIGSLEGSSFKKTWEASENLAGQTDLSNFLFEAKKNVYHLIFLLEVRNQGQWKAPGGGGGA